ncbi:alpha-hydroxy acid oxidase [Euzebya tangerina]|uniref:alpha-hydroxy acid oxidase n=1 Tax=Euzebya tangerina TaxID=591198 RepID=UPI000E31CB69|nr:alpha-hydroxy acid oxidase [Euzebya tangerina]
MDTLGRLVTVEDVRRRARLRLPRMAFEFVDGGAGDEVTLRANRTAFEQVSIQPKVLTGVSDRDLSVSVVGQELALPLVFSPAGLLRVTHPAGETAAAAAASAAGVPFTLSTGSSRSIEEVAQAGGDGLRWFQLYLWKDRAVVEGLLDRAARAGYSALVLTVDVPVVGQRDRDIRNGMTLPPRPNLRTALDTAWRPWWWWPVLTGEPITFANFTDLGLGESVTELGRFVNTAMINPEQSWADVAWLREQWTGPMLVKGILRAEDASRSVDCGADAVVVSNHGGRQLDGAPAAFAVLDEVVGAVGGRADVILDGGVRRGADVVKALAAGAAAVMIGRPYVYGLAAGGQAGVARVLEILSGEIDRTLALTGCRRARDLDRSFLLDARLNSRQSAVDGARSTPL